VVFHFLGVRFIIEQNPAVLSYPGNARNAASQPFKVFDAVKLDSGGGVPRFPGKLLLKPTVEMFIGYPKNFSGVPSIL
jgi:hypothetical protein